MLILSRKPGEEIQLRIPPSAEEQIVTIRTVRIGSNTARIGVEADRQVEIVRVELLEKLETQLEPVPA
ncbi:MAG: hypothetical protein A3E01_03100 [Gammaproteobacteria bacterium RIFCSPHIGHO2_12_FULL_63_22]|nr:MAG: hypothetical protein A3E01_03100 [Gammaproteobacteria bacterium RIFCSPHIGHO2_12_FULL_63_22]